MLLDYVNPSARVNFNVYAPANTENINEQVIISDFRKVSFNPFEKRDVWVGFDVIDSLGLFVQEKKATSEIIECDADDCKKLTASNGQIYTLTTKTRFLGVLYR